MHRKLVLSSVYYHVHKKNMRGPIHCDLCRLFENLISCSQFSFVVTWRQRKDTSGTEEFPAKSVRKMETSFSLQRTSVGGTGAQKTIVYNIRQVILKLILIILESL